MVGEALGAAAEAAAVVGGMGTSALGTAGSDDTTKLAPRYSIPQRMKWGLVAFAIQKLVLAPLFLLHRVYDLLTPSSGGRPTFTKSYPTRSSLRVR